MPSKEEIRQWMQQRQVDHKPPPKPEDIRRELGWGLLAKAKHEDR